MEILELFGVNWKLMLAQIVNFAIVFFVLWRFAIKPLLKTMESRNQEISAGLDNAKQAEERLLAVEKEVKAQLNVAKKEAMLILDKANSQAEENRKLTLNKAKSEVEVVVAKAKEQIAQEKEKMFVEAKKEFSQMLVLALDKVLSKNLSKEIDQKYIKQALGDLKEKN
ncbi:F0F1 ATP synthase subunit B [Patescibacteria group bacterium]|nr:F0F1 ATP synthase subunit B [Patescibacteria group bacterium]